MNVKEAKEQIKNAMKAYFKKGEFGNYVIPTERQRPIFLVGAPGIGKTAIMEQIASEFDVPLVSYSITHHTRQSALGLPFISKKKYGEKEYSVSEYTMSEIIASVYDMMEKTGKKEGILFIDEINCASETLMPSMLQFLQYKVFGTHKVPEGWIVVTAGNPPEYNDSVRRFDVVTMDRLKRIDVEPDLCAWREYARDNKTHPSILTYLDIKPNAFYKIESTVDGKSFVTARGWSDLGEMIKVYERSGTEVDIKLVSQYIQDRKTAEDFSLYYDLFNKYKTDYKVLKVLDGEIDDEVVSRAQNAPFDEKIALVGLISDALDDGFCNIARNETALSEVAQIIRDGKSSFADGDGATEYLSEKADEKISVLEIKKAASSLSYGEKQTLLEENALLKSLASNVKTSEINPFDTVKKLFGERVNELRETVDRQKSRLSNAFAFLDQAVGDGSEMLIFVTGLTDNAASSRFISKYGCDEYFNHNKELLFYERQKEIIKSIDGLDIE